MDNLTTELTPGWKPGTSNEDHHRGLYKDCIGSSGIKRFADYSAAHFREDMLHPSPSTPAMVVGSAFHSLALGFPDEVAQIPTDINRRTNAGKADWESFMAANQDKYLISAGEYANLMEMVGALNRHPISKKLMGFEDRELTGIWNDVDNKLWCKIRPDLIGHDQRIIVDLKSTNDASRPVFNRDIFKFGYHISAAWYKYGAKMITGNDYAFVIVAVEKSPPYGINCFNISGLAIKKAWTKIGECLGDIADAFNLDKWPNYEARLWEPDVPSYII